MMNPRTTIYSRGNEDMGRSARPVFRPDWPGDAMDAFVRIYGEASIARMMRPKGRPVKRDDGPAKPVAQKVEERRTRLAGFCEAWSSSRTISEASGEKYNYVVDVMPKLESQGLVERRKVMLSHSGHGGAASGFEWRRL